MVLIVSLALLIAGCSNAGSEMPQAETQQTSQAPPPATATTTQGECRNRRPDSDHRFRLHRGEPDTLANSFGGWSNGVVVLIAVVLAVEAVLQIRAKYQAR
jgi:hypothetical protein